MQVFVLLFEDKRFWYQISSFFFLNLPVLLAVCLASPPLIQVTELDLLIWSIHSSIWTMFKVSVAAFQIEFVGGLNANTEALKYT